MLETVKMRRALAWTAIVGVLLLPYLNCSPVGDTMGLSGSSLNGGAPINTGAILETLRAQKTQVFATHCVGCHNSTTTENTTLTSLDLAVLDQRNLVNLGSPQTSPLYLGMVDGIHPAGSSVSPAEIVIIRDWIAAEGGNFDTYIGGSPIDPGGGGTSNTPFTPVRTVLRQNCTSCHNAGGQQPNLDLDAPGLRAAVFNGARLVIPNNPNGSLLLTAFGSMPDGAPLGVNSSQANVIRTWIANGAQ